MEAPKIQATVRIVSLNVHGWKDRIGYPERDKAIQFIQSLKPTIVALQEVILGEVKPSPIDILAAALAMDSVFESSEADDFGNVLLWKKDVVRNVTTKGNELKVAGAYTRSWVLLKGEVHDTPLTVCCTHLDHKSEHKRVLQMKQIKSELSGTPPLVIVGDFNSLYRPDYSAADIDRIDTSRRSKRIQPSTFEVMEELAKHYQVFPELFKATCPYGTRVDYALMNKALLSTAGWQVAHSEITDIEVSDHAAVILDLQITQRP